MSSPWSASLAHAHTLAGQARFADCLAQCQQLLDTHSGEVGALLDVAALLLGFGFLSAARQCLDHARHLAPNDLRPLVNLANLAREAGEHAVSRQLYARLLAQLPDHPMIRRNALVSLEYDPDVSAADRLAQAVDWGTWAMARAGGMRPRPALPALANRPLRVGYVSADFCQHTVGLFVKDVLLAHDPQRVTVLAYNASTVNDWVTAALRQGCLWREVGTLDDTALAALIRQDEVDVLVDLSGHTAGSRLTVFAHRPAPVLVSWLGYFATTGLPVMDAVLLDGWHAPAGTESQFVEPIVRLPQGRFCYTPVPFAPTEVAPPPCVANGFVTFGCFNNSAKLNPRVLATWAAILQAVPTARLVLKWRTFEDAALRDAVTAAFETHGIDPARLTLRGASFHADLLREYADIDIALDPFPFTGGLSSCEALWMGVPIITWPQAQVVSRQTWAFLSVIGHPEWAATCQADYVQQAVALAADVAHLAQLRTTLRPTLQASPLCQVAAFTRGLEDALMGLAHTVAPA